MWRLVTDPAVQLYPELPLAGVAGAQDDLLLSGRVDLLVRDPRRDPSTRWTVLDFKAAGKHFPGCRHQAPKDGSPSWDEPTEILMKETKLDHYGPQLKAYRDVIDGALSQSPAFEKERVGELGLWFVRTGAHVTWRGRVQNT